LPLNCIIKCWATSLNMKMEAKKRRNRLELARFSIKKRIKQISFGLMFLDSLF
jgi:hypothetical protein